MIYKKIRPVILIAIIYCVVCQKSSSPVSPDKTTETSEHLIITSSNETYYSLAKEIQSYYNANIVSLSDTNIQLLEMLRKIKPTYVIIVLPYELIEQKLVGELFKSFCSLDDDIHLDVNFGYITGQSVEKARDLFYRGKNKSTTIDEFITLTHTYDDGSAVRNLTRAYQMNFENTGWPSNIIPVNSDIWKSDSSLFLQKFNGNQIIFCIGEGTPFDICRLYENHFSQINLNQSIVLSGACQTGKIDKPDYIAHQILNKGASNYISNIIVHGWIYMYEIAENICKNNKTIGQSTTDGLNKTLAKYGITNLNIYNLYNTDIYGLSDEDWHANRIARIIPFGDPTSQLPPPEVVA